MHEERRNPIVTVVGGSGFLGRYVVKLLAKDGYVIRVLSRDPERAHGLKTLGQVGQIVPEAADLSRPETLKGKLDGSFAVVNLTGILFEKGRQRFAALHAQGAERLAQLAREAGAEAYVHISALGIEQGGGSRYARTKLLGEKATVAAFPAATVLRPSVIFGPEDDFFNRFARLACYSPVLPLVGAKTRLQPVYAGDVAEAVRRALAMPAMRGKIYELGGPDILTFRELLAFTLETTHRSSWLLPVPFGVASLLAVFTELLPSPPLTRDQVRLLHNDNVVRETALKLGDIGIAPASIEAIVPAYLARFCRRVPKFAY